MTSLVLFLMYVDHSADINSYRTEYNGSTTTTLQERRAYLSNDTEHIFWFIHVTDVHLGAYTLTGNSRQRFRDFLENAKQIYNSSYQTFIVDTGDLVNGELPVPIVQDESQWRERNTSIAAAGWWDQNLFYDMPGNHDGYGNSDSFSYYLNWSVQQKLNYNWTRSFIFGNYTFISLNSAPSHGEQWPWGTDAELDRTELDAFEQMLIAAQDSNLTFLFTHHQLSDMGGNTSTSGKTFLELLEEYKVAAHIYGHGHENEERNQGGTIAIESDSLGQSFDVPGYRIFAVDNDGISTKFQALNSWPAVIITCPIDRGLTMQAFDIDSNLTAVPIRALVFDVNDIISAEFRIDGGSWHSMNQASINEYLWTASFNASNFGKGEHSIQVRAISSSGTTSDSITVRIGTFNQPEIVNGPLPSFTRTKDCSSWTLDLSMYEWDLKYKANQLNWSVFNLNPSLCTVTITDIENDLVIFTSVSGATGTANINFTLLNADGMTVSQVIKVTLVDRIDFSTFQMILAISAVLVVVCVILFNFLLEKRSQDPAKIQNSSHKTQFTLYS